MHAWAVKQAWVQGFGAHSGLTRAVMPGAVCALVLKLLLKLVLWVVWGSRWARIGLERRRARRHGVGSSLCRCPAHGGWCAARWGIAGGVAGDGRLASCWLEIVLYSTHAHAGNGRICCPCQCSYS